MTGRIKVYVVLTAAAAALCLLAAGWHVPVQDQTRHWNAIVAFAVLGFVSEASYLRLRVGRSETQSSVAFIPYIACILLFDTGWAVLVAATADLGAEWFVRRKPPLKIVFNVGQQVVSVAMASWVYHSLGGGSSLTAFEGIPVAGDGAALVSRFAPLATAAAIVTYFAINSTAVTGAVALSDRLPFEDAWRRIAGPSLVYDIFSSGLGPILALVYVRSQNLGILIVVLPLFFVRHIYQVNLQLEQVNRDLLELMVKAIEARDPYTSGHSLRVSQIAAELARERGLGAKLVEQVTTGALLHDVGKIHEDFAPLLRKPSKLDATERALMQTHPSRSAELVSTISAFRGTIELAVRHHHENFDGSGYPLGLAGEVIPIAARVIMLADTMDAMTTDRPYRKALSYERVIEELRRYSGRQFDPALVAAAERSVAIKAIVKARHRRESADAPLPGLAVFAHGDRPAWLNRVAAGA
jgi:putative nucleotidyltransferase with HDIG domain